MSYKPILLVAGEPNSIFLEIFFKAIQFKNFKSPLILIASEKTLINQMKKFKFKKKINKIDYKNLSKLKLNNKQINLIDVKYKFSKDFQKISGKSNKYIKDSFEIAFKILRDGITTKFINGPISKKNFFKKKYFGMTEYLASKFKIKKNAMLIFNKNLSVCPVTTHLPLKNVVKGVSRKAITDKVILINNFYKKKLHLKPKIAVLGLNPHCESTDKFNEDEKITKPAIKKLAKLGYDVAGPYPADTIFLRNNRKKFNVILGMYHDQVLTPVKTLFEYDAINITLGLPFVRISPDHGPNEKMLGKNLSNPLSLIRAISFLDNKID